MFRAHLGGQPWPLSTSLSTGFRLGLMTILNHNFELPALGTLLGVFSGATVKGASRALANGTASGPTTGLSTAKPTWTRRGCRQAQGRGRGRP